jgi:hypothetical protein
MHIGAGKGEKSKEEGKKKDSFSRRCRGEYRTRICSFS